MIRRSKFNNYYILLS